MSAAVLCSQTYFLNMACCSDVVVAARVTPSQKAEMVRLVKKMLTPQPITLAIGKRSFFSSWQWAAAELLKERHLVLVSARIRICLCALGTEKSVYTLATTTRHPPPRSARAG